MIFIRYLPKYFLYFNKSNLLFVQILDVTYYFIFLYYNTLLEAAKYVLLSTYYAGIHLLLKTC